MRFFKQVLVGIGLARQLGYHTDRVQSQFLFDLLRAVKTRAQEMQTEHQSAGRHEAEDKDNNERAPLVRVRRQRRHLGG